MFRSLDYIRSQIYPHGGYPGKSDPSSGRPQTALLGTVVVMLGVIALAYALTGLSQL